MVKKQRNDSEWIGQYAKRTKNKEETPSYKYCVIDDYCWTAMINPSIEVLDDKKVHRIGSVCVGTVEAV